MTSDHDNVNNDDVKEKTLVESSDTMAASLSAIINPSPPKKKYNKNNNDEEAAINQSHKRKYPGEHYVTYRSYDQGGEYHTAYAILLQYCQDVLLRINNEWLQQKISTFENILNKHKLWLEEYFNQERFLTESEPVIKPITKKQNQKIDHKAEDEDILDDIVPLTVINTGRDGHEGGTEVEEEGERQQETLDHNDKDNTDDQVVNDSEPEIDKEVIEDSEVDSEVDESKKESISLNKANPSKNSSNKILSDNKGKEVTMPIEGELNEDNNDDENDYDFNSYKNDLIDVLLKYEEKDEIEYPYY